ncbi:MAG: ATP phosphoribosyltransferase [Fimbriimonadaceae bacterium]|nr:ATP phosphoribosyltransferase [Alphaproteobacteria bacterium]
MTRPLIIGVPSKGRLQENAAAFFTRAGLKIVKSGGARTYTGIVKGFDTIEIAFLSASEISRQLADGKIHMGITGEDLLRENIPDADNHVELVTALGFGFANVVVAVPQAWIDVSSMADLDDVSAGLFAKHTRRMRVATKYINLTRSFFDTHDIVDYRIVESLGATEGAPAAGSADIIVDITTTGATLAANALKILEDGTILESQANLAISLNADWPAEIQATCARVLERIASYATAQEVREIRFSGDNPDLTAQAIARFDCTAPFGESRAANPVTLHCPRHNVYNLVSWLRSQKVGTVSVTQPEYVFTARNALFEKIAKRLNWTG